MSARYLDTSLGDYLKEATGLPWKWAEHDCCAWPARWAGIPLPQYSDEAGALAHIDDAGGLVALWSRCIGNRLAQTDEPDPGDVAVIIAVAPDRTATEVGAIWTGKRWAFLTPKGLGCASATTLAIWRVPCPKP